MSASYATVPVSPPAPPKSIWRKRLNKAGFAALVIAVCAVTFFPIYWMIITTLRPTRFTLTYPPSFIPEAIDLSVFREVFAEERVDPPTQTRESHDLCRIERLQPAVDEHGEPAECRQIEFRLAARRQQRAGQLADSVEVAFGRRRNSTTTTPASITTAGSRMA